MFDIRHALRVNKLFKNLSDQELNQFLITSGYHISDFQTGQIIALEGERLTQIGLVLEGTIEVQKNYPSGKMVVVNRLKAGGVFGEVVIFSDKKVYPSTIYSATRSKIMLIDKENVLKICLQNGKFLNNLLQLLSEKILVLNHRLHILSGETIRQKICLYLLEQYQKQKTLSIPIHISRETMAEQFGITRPSLSRELGNMKRDGMIDFDKKHIIIKDLASLKQLF